jgi:ABC-type multidrug transport system fused ATPase/permease subunit
VQIFQELKIIWKYLKKYKKRVWLLIFLALIASGISASIPYIYGRLVDLVSIQPSELSFVLWLLGAWFATSMSSSFLTWVINRSGSTLSVDAYNDLICKSASHLIALPLGFHKEKKTGEIFSKIDRAGDSLLRIIDEVLFWTLPQVLAAVMAISFLSFIEWHLALGAATLFLGYIALTIYKTSLIIKTQEKLNKIIERVSGNLYDSLSNVAIIKSCAVESFQKRRTEKDYREKFGSIFKKYLSLWHSVALWQSAFYSLSFIAIFGVALLFLNRGIISAGKLVMFLGYLNLVRAPLRGLAYHWQAFRTGMTSIKRVEKVLKIPPEDYKKEGKALKEVKGKVEFKNISFGYKEKILILKNVSFVAQPGQKIAIVGGSGEGKTTLVDLISLYFKPLKGKILIDGIDIQEMNLQFLRKMIAYVPQEITLFNDTVKNNILYGKPNATEKEIIEAAKAANTHYFIESFPKKYETLVGERGIKLSTGQKQRIAIARALIRDPKILILDEATSSLDSESERLVQEALERLTKGRTTFIVAHRLSTVRNADKILVLEKGKIVEQGTHQELIKKKGAYYKFYSLQFQPNL